MVFPPSGTPPTSMTVSSSFTSRDTSLNGCETRIASWTPGMVSKNSGSRPPLFPVIPMATRCAPGMGWAVSPRERIRSTTEATSPSLAWGFMTTSIRTSVGNLDS